MGRRKNGVVWLWERHGWSVGARDIRGLLLRTYYPLCLALARYIYIALQQRL